MNISFFAKKHFYHKADGHLMRGSSIIRAEQIAEYLGAKINPIEGYENDICIYVKPSVKIFTAEFMKDLFRGKRNYLDIIDGYNWISYLSSINRDIPVIVCSQHDQEYLSSILDNEIVFIPQHSCNFERERKETREVKTIGIIGARLGNKQIPKDLEKRLNDIGLKLVVYSSFKRRSDIIKFYKSIDLQVIWRPWKKELSNPLKIVNAISFGVPTVALDELAFKELGGYYISVTNIEELISKIQMLKSNPELYRFYAEKGIVKSEEYHISNIAEIYKRL